MNPLDRRTFFQAVAAGVVPAAAAGAAPAPSPPGRSLPPPKETAPELRRSPYLQAQGPDRVVVRWRNDPSVTECQIRFGESLDSLDRTVAARRLATPFAGINDWAAVIEGLKPSRRYYYAVEASAAILAGADEDHFFRTSPPAGQRSPTRFWVLGDCGTNRVHSGSPGKSVAARNGFRKFNRGRGLVDGIILLGDNAYSHGTDAQYQTALFSVYRDELRNTVVWPCIGNHELTDDYFSIFTVPENGEAGGIPSHCTNYYSFDYANIHVTVLDLWKAEWRHADAPQRRWLERDLAATRQDWTVVVNHFPPYCDGKYESDHNGFLVDVRERILPILEGHGVDLLLTGHDHTYQRSYLLDGHHGTRDSFDPALHRKAVGDGHSEPIVKGHGPHSGLIVVVSGTAGAEQGIDPNHRHGNNLSHPAMVKLPQGDQAGRGARRLGTFLLEIDGLTLTGTQVDHLSKCVDRFRLVKRL